MNAASELKLLSPTDVGPLSLDFAAKAIDLHVPAQLQAVKRCYDAVSTRASAAA